MRALLAVTTANQIAYNRQAFHSILAGKPGYVDVMVVDDASDDGTVELARSLGFVVVTKDKPRGHIDSLNLAYRDFVQKDYDVLILANNDILVPSGALENLCAALSRNVVVSPMSTLKGVGHQPGQALRQHFPDIDIDETNPANCQRVQDKLNSLGLARGSVRELPYLNSFVIGMNRRAREFELPGGLIFDPRNVNVGNEDEFCERVKDKKHVCIDSFVFHFKGVTLELSNIDDTTFELNVNRELIWKRAEAIRDSPLKRFVYKLGRRIARVLPKKIR
jgi:glycosyltransferase involved in cell wall biosynthesis